MSEFFFYFFQLPLNYMLLCDLLYCHYVLEDAGKKDIQ